MTCRHLCLIKQKNSGSAVKRRQPSAGARREGAARNGTENAGRKAARQNSSMAVRQHGGVPFTGARREGAARCRTENTGRQSRTAEQKHGSAVKRRQPSAGARREGAARNGTEKCRTESRTAGRTGRKSGSGRCNKTDETEKKKRPIRKRHGVPVEPEVCLSEASDIMCRATYRAIKLACDTDGGNGGEAACAKSLKEYWAVLKEALSVTGSIKDGEDGENVLRVVMDESADRFSE